MPDRFGSLDWIPWTVHEGASPLLGEQQGLFAEVTSAKGRFAGLNAT
ncbi:MAG: hypothetical protein QF819_00905 [Gemmatimonadota bacterium]|jgi:hypothetical protein|nr:hypothetical protein [Gemmatimonadota bacterium]MDP6529898.1 hypothetical protein [Gemmatimonadota bacterium]MDP6801725.1 hypothetical protein [Gemmatimonadota bacterium]MDP7031199.1 hypothetical protein [Gemmatimonadota bacterium]